MSSPQQSPPWVSPHADPAVRAAYEHIQTLAVWSPWAPFATAAPQAPRLPGVYAFREPATGVIRYVGMAGERRGSGTPQGVRGRLNVYSRGKGAVSGFGEAALDRALADPAWLRQQLTLLETDGPRRAKEWAASAIARLSLEVSWATTADRNAARALEQSVVDLARPHGLWNR